MTDKQQLIEHIKNILDNNGIRSDIEDGENKAAESIATAWLEDVEQARNTVSFGFGSQ